MNASSTHKLLLRAIAACVAAVVQAKCSATPPVWQPYRDTCVASQSPAAMTAQYVAVEPMQGIPIDAVTDADLDLLSSACCNPAVTVNPLFDPVIGLPTTGTAAAHHAVTPDGFQVLPSDVIWHSYWAGAKEPRTSATAFEEFGDDLSLLDVSLGGRTAILRNAARDPTGLWQGWELQIEGAAILRLNLDQDWDFDSADFRFGVPLILARNQVHYKLAYYHLSSHVGDEFLERNPGFMRINFSRDVLVLGASYFPLPTVRWYGEVGWAFYDDEGSDPWELQFGVDIAQPGPTGTTGTPFIAVNGHLREEVNFGGNLVVQGGWLWRGQTGRVLRTGVHYFNGKSSQFEFFDSFEQQLGVGLWQEY